MTVCGHNEFERFRFFVLPNNTRDAVNMPVSSDPDNPTVLARLSIHSDPNDAVWLTAAVGWQADILQPEVLFKIWRGEPVTGLLIFSAKEKGETADRFKATSFSHVDTIFTKAGEYAYTLTAEVTEPGNAAVVTGPITFTAAEIEFK